MASGEKGATKSNERSVSAVCCMSCGLGVGVGITRIGEGYGVKLNLEGPPAPDANLPNDVDGVPIRVEVVGAIRKR